MGNELFWLLKNKPYLRCSVISFGSAAILPFWDRTISTSCSKEFRHSHGEVLLSKVRCVNQYSKEHGKFKKKLPKRWNKLWGTMQRMTGNKYRVQRAASLSEMLSLLALSDVFQWKGFLQFPSVVSNQQWNEKLPSDKRPFCIFVEKCLTIHSEVTKENFHELVNFPESDQQIFQKHSKCKLIVQWIHFSQWENDKIV